MTHAERLHELADKIREYGPDLSQWTDPSSVSKELRGCADALTEAEERIKELGHINQRRVSDAEPRRAEGASSASRAWHSADGGRTRQTPEAVKAEV